MMWRAALYNVSIFRSTLEMLKKRGIPLRSPIDAIYTNSDAICKMLQGDVWYMKSRASVDDAYKSVM